MQLIFLDRNNLSYKDNGFIDNKFEIDQDLVLIKRSTFVVNKTNINTSVGDIVALKIYNHFYIGIIETIEHSSNNETNIKTVDFKGIFNFEVPLFSYTGDVSTFLENIISKHLLDSSDPNQNLSYIVISKEASFISELTFEEDKLMTLQDVLELISKTYGISIKFEVVFLRGRITGIKLRIVEVTKGIKLKSNLSFITDLVVSDSDSQVINKVTYYPKSENKIYKNVIDYYLLKSGEVTIDASHTDRYRTVNKKSYTYSDSDFESLEAKVRSELKGTNLDHNITFNIKVDNEVVKPLVDLNIGDFIEFYTNTKVYNSVITGMVFKNTFSVCSLTLGEYRIKLTEKIQLLNKNVTSAVGNVAIQNNMSNTIDGGEF